MGLKPKRICQKIDKEETKWRLKKKSMEEETWKIFLYENQRGGSKIEKGKTKKIIENELRRIFTIKDKKRDSKKKNKEET